MGCANGVAVSSESVEPTQRVHSTITFEEEYSICEMIGKGAFGKVYSVSQRSTGKQCAVKSIELFDKKLSLEKRDQQASIKLKKANLEIEMWQAVGKHPNVVELHGRFIEQSIFWMVMEMCAGTVTDMLSSGTFRKSDMPWLLREMLLGVQACHQASVVHRDIKMDNFLVGKDARKVKICDFGLAARLKPGLNGLEGEVGTPPMMSPEMLLKRKLYDTSTDVWSFGAMSYYALFKELPYVPKEITAKGAKEAIRVGKPTPRFLVGVPRQRDKAAVDFLRGLLEREPADRVTATEALEHPYIAEELKLIPGQVDTASTLAPLDDEALLSSADSQDAGDLIQ